MLYHCRIFVTFTSYLNDIDMPDGLPHPPTTPIKPPNVIVEEENPTENEDVKEKLD